MQSAVERGEGGDGATQGGEGGEGDEDSALADSPPLSSTPVNGSLLKLLKFLNYLYSEEVNIFLVTIFSARNITSQSSNINS